MALIQYKELVDSLFTEANAGGRIHKFEEIYSNKTLANNLLTEEVRTFSAARTYDVFLSYSLTDLEAATTFRLRLKKLGLSVFMDKSVRDAGPVTKTDAERIRKAINASKAFLYVLSEHSTESRWMQWELGFADGSKKGRVAIVPLEKDGRDREFYRREFLKLYPYIDAERAAYYVNGTKKAALNEWLSEANAYSFIN